MQLRRCVAGVVVLVVVAAGTAAVGSRVDAPTAAATPVGSDAAVPPGAGFHPLPPVRVLDSREGTGSPASPWGAGESRPVAVAGTPGIPPEATAVALNLVAVSPSEATHLTVWPAGQAMPLASSLNVPAGDARANLVVVPVGAAGAVAVANNAGSVHVVADVAGWFGAGGDRLSPSSPTRVLDSRDGTGSPPSPWSAGEVRPVGVAGVAGVPADATAVVVNVTAVAPTAGTHLTVWPAGLAMPLASSLNVPAGDARANLVVVPVGAGGAVSVFNQTGSVHVVADVAGWFSAAGSTFTPAPPVRVLDSRDGTGGFVTPWIGGVARDVVVAGTSGVPVDATAVVLNLTAVAPSTATHLTVWPAGQAMPLASSLNVPAGDTRANLVVVPVGDGGRVSVASNSGFTHVVADVAGWFRADDADPCAATGTVAHLDQRYRNPATLPPGTDPDLVSLDAYELVRPPACPPAPALVWVHGGGWSVGDKRNQLRDKLALARSQGWTLVSVNYRLSPAVTYPTHNDDVGAAIDFVVDHAAELRVDPAHIELMGHSAGAGISAALGTDARHLQRSGRGLADVECMVLLDTEGYDVAAQALAGDGPYLQAFGTDPAVWAEASPINHIEPGKDIPPALVVTRGTPTRVALSNRFAADLVTAGVPASVVLASPLTHEGVNDAVGHPGDTIVTPPLVAFLDGCVG